MNNARSETVTHDIILPLSVDSTNNFLELRYTLRSLEKHLTGYGQIFIIGHRPDWLKNIIHIPAKDTYGLPSKEGNICRKIMLACKDERVSEDFVLYNDDNFLLSNFNALNLPYYFKGTLHETLQRRLGRDPYMNTIINTITLLKGLGVSQYDYDGHFLITYNKSCFVKKLGQFKWEQPWGYGIKSLYCNMTGVGGFKRQDLKIREPELYETIKDMIKERTYFSTHEKAINPDMIRILNKLYPKKSKYE